MRITERYVEANGVTLFVEERGNPAAPPVLMVMGLGCQLTLWPEDLVNDLVDRGYRVIRFDNRDVGLSSKIDGNQARNLPLAYAQYMLGLKAVADYTLYDMADDTIGLMNALDLKSAHVVGISMGGMISQILAAKYPERVKSLTLMMTSSNEARMAAVNLAATWHLCRGRFAGETWDAFRSIGLGYWRAIQSPKYPTPTERMEEILKRDFDRCYHPCGVERQIMAIAATGSLRKLLPKITQATQVIHGQDDPLLKAAGAKAIAKQIKHAQLKIIPGMGHDLPDELLPEFAHLIHRNIVRSSSSEFKQARDAKPTVTSVFQRFAAWAES